MNKLEKRNLAKDIIHSLYNSFAEAKNDEFNDMRNILLKAYKKLDSSNIANPSILVERLVKCLYWISFNKKIHLTPEQENLILQLSDIGKNGGFNGIYANFSSRAPF